MLYEFISETSYVKGNVSPMWARVHGDACNSLGMLCVSFVYLRKYGNMEVCHLMTTLEARWS